VSVVQLEEIVDDIEARLSEKPDREITSTEVGELVMRRLHDLDEVAYVRFASVYRQFKDVHQFVEEVKSLLGPGKRAKSSRLLKKAHLRGPSLRLGTPHAGALVRRTGSRPGPTLRWVPRPAPHRLASGPF